MYIHGGAFMFGSGTVFSIILQFFKRVQEIDVLKARFLDVDVCGNSSNVGLP
jgi:hypothetical protein